ncbi:hypothetical protein, partial [Vibrio parahaemolyticus]|uniref:hypothetical protein n=1 Tax=Vibrio parahaemolyticus TaxID=670 RepID=UPI0021120571
YGGIREVPPVTVVEEYFSLGDAPMMPCNVHTEWDPTYDVTGSIGVTPDTIPELLPGAVGTSYVPSDRYSIGDTRPAPPPEIDAVPPLA